jgi:hypothetical protein
LSSETKKKTSAAASNPSDAFAASLLPEDIHTGLPMFFMKSSEIYSRIRAIRSNPTRVDEQRALAEDIMKRRKVQNPSNWHNICHLNCHWGYVVKTAHHLIVCKHINARVTRACARRNLPKRVFWIH